MSAAESFEPALRDKALAPLASDLVLAEWTTDGALDGERLYPAPLHRHADDEAWYVLEACSASGSARRRSRSPRAAP
ncbi:hypothetical protein K3N28_15155 [Glycomyces sp. TRM65418]|uniref:hypothetical protein n=1 Tax=Glycomyces sp. TRM65418 TaxID=2867006 RepID=UPI001CE623D1|nr:hypothetical protein [Glycomyces sp. TRM65418]MCC3764403.1 hypothetical protein [Glycomyces sp. TRM65418]QZD54079.1 hypothetical protein K3N28_15080 [Glycomyces sp. TRM65418]